MGFRVDIRTNFFQIEKGLEDLKRIHIIQSARRAINRALITTRKESVSLYREHLKLKRGDIVKRTTMNKARGGSLSSMEGSLVFSGIPISLLTFVKGNKDTIKLKGVPIKKRRKLKVEIQPGKKLLVKGGFIQRARTKQVFKGKKGLGFKKQGTPSLGEVFRKNKFERKLLPIARQAFTSVFEREIKKRLEGIVKTSALR